LFVNLKKCTFAAEEVAYLGFIVGRHGVSSDPEKIRTIVE
jgi:hypothetical protein